jgi:hypothetical protein
MTWNASSPSCAHNPERSPLRERPRWILQTSQHLHDRETPVMAAELDGYPSLCRFMQAQFEGQTKTKLGNTKVKTITNEAIS